MPRVLTGVNPAIDALYEQVDGLQISIDVDLSALEAADVALDARLDTAETDIDQLQFDLSDAEGRLATAETDINQLEFDLGDAEGRIAVLEALPPAHAIQDEGVPAVSRLIMNFVGAGVTVTDDAIGLKTVVTIPSGGGLSTAGAGLTESPAGTVNVGQHADASVVVNTNDVQVAASIQSGAAAGATAVQPARQIISGNGLTGGGDLSADRTLNVVANADGSIVANANDVQVGVLATDAQHGVRGGGTQHPAVSNTAAGFAPAITGGSLVLTSNAGGTAATWAAAGGGGGGPTMASLSSAYTNSSTTGTEVTGLPLTSLAAGNYCFEYDLIIRTAAAATGLSLGMNFTGTHTALVARMEYLGTGTTASTGIIDDDTAGATDQLQEAFCTRTESTTAPDMGPLTGVATANQDHYIHVRGVIVVTVSGDLELWCASEVAASQVDIRIGSSVRLWKTG